jgi:hypothetical protein
MGQAAPKRLFRVDRSAGCRSAPAARSWTNGDRRGSERSFLGDAVFTRERDDAIEKLRLEVAG